MKIKLRSLKVSDLRTGKVESRFLILHRGKVVSAASFRELLPVGYFEKGVGKA